MSEPPLRHWWLLALSHTLRWLIAYADRRGEATGGSVEVTVAKPEEQTKDG